jgi:hypothetical protein
MISLPIAAQIGKYLGPRFDGPVDHDCEIENTRRDRVIGHPVTWGPSPRLWTSRFTEKMASDGILNSHNRAVLSPETQVDHAIAVRV